MSASLPSAPNIEHLKYQAKDLQRSVHAADPAALQRVAVYHSGASPAPFRLADSQFVVAREYGFSSWPKLRAYVDSISGDRSHRLRPFHTDIAYYEDRAEGLRSMHSAGLPEALREIKEFHPTFAGMTEAQVAGAAFTREDALLVTAREHGFESWQRLRAQVKALASGTAFEPFLAAFQAIERDDFAAFERLIRRDGSLINARGTNGNTLLNLTASCKRLDMSKLLVEVGTNVNLANNRGSTALHQAGYSNNCPLAEFLLGSGADVRLYGHGDGGTPLWFALFWGHREVADLLAAYGAVPGNLRIAAGLGRIEMMGSFFQRDGSLTPDAGSHRAVYRPHSGFPVWQPSDNPKEILDEAFVYAAKSGRIEAMQLLLNRGADVNGDPYRGPALHWAAANGNASVVGWLVQHGANVNLRATFGGPSHGEGLTAIHLAAQNGNTDMCRLLVDLGADPTITEDNYQSSAIGWTSHFGHTALEEYLRASVLTR